MKRASIIIFYVIILFVLIFINKLGNSLQFSPTFAKKNHLMEEIKERIHLYETEPEDAYIDRVWKKTPGRNGLRVLVNESYVKMKKSGQFDESLLVFEEIPPKVTLDDLPAAPIYRGHPEKMMVSFLINVSWGTEHIPAILQTLNTYNVKATFFIEGKWAQENKEYVRMIDEQGHLIGNHAYNHPDMATLSKDQMMKQINDTNEIIEAIVKIRPKWFAPPSGSFNDQVVNVAHDYGMETILWTVDTIDWKNPSVSVMINRVMKNIHPGAMILMHPTEPVERGLAQLIEAIQEKDYKIGTVENLLNESR